METETALWTAADVAAYLRIPETVVFELADSSRLPHLSLAGHLRFRKEDVERWVNLQVSGAHEHREPEMPLPAPAIESSEVICGYRVRVEYRPSAGGEPSARKAIAAVIARSILRRREDAKRDMSERQISPSSDKTASA
jgi:excisionase family DNA binding protein